MSETDKRPECKICFKRFSRTANLTKHLRIHNDDKPFQCEVCHKRFTNASNLIRHCMTHTGERNYQCNMCSMKFTDPSNLRRHVLMHTSRKAYQCEVCFKNFSSISNLQTHSRIHTGDKPYECDVCTRSFTQSYDLKLHQYVHTGERPFKCDYCPKTYSHPSNLRKHHSSHYREMTYGKTRRGRAAKNVQPTETEEMLAVNDIRVIYNTEETLLSELQGNETEEMTFTTIDFTEDVGQSEKNETLQGDVNHTDESAADKMYKCDVCKKGFSTLSNLQFHAQKHRGNKPYECSVCNRGFSQFYDLKLHRYVHTGERPFKCDSCTKCYSHPSNLRKHRKTHNLDASEGGKKGKKRKVKKTNKKSQDVSINEALLNDADKTETKDMNSETEISNSESDEIGNVLFKTSYVENSKIINSNEGVICQDISVNEALPNDVETNYVENEISNTNEDIISNLVYNIIEIITHLEIYGT